MAGANSQRPSALAWKRFRKNTPAMIGLGWLLICTIVALAAYPLMPDDTHNGNFQVIELPKQPPLASYTLLLQANKAQQPAPGIVGYLLEGRPDNFTPVAVQDPASISISQDTLRYRDRLGRLQVAWLPEWMHPIDKHCAQATQWKAATGKPYRWHGDSLTYVDLDGKLQSVDARLQADLFRDRQIVQGRFLLGSDAFGRDLLSRLILGTRVSLGIGLMAVMVSLLLGVSLGAMAGFFRGRVDQVIMWFVSVVWSIPTLLLAIALAFVMGKGTWQLFVAIGISSWVEVARIVRGQIFSLREQQFVEATKALGYRWPRVIVRHMLPNVLSPLIIVAAANFASAILMEAGLSFLGVGVQPPAPSWGSMIKEGYAQVMFDSGAWLAIFPGLAIILVVISLNLVGFGLRDALDPKHKE
jgi:ABC-type dipeptide/oligopeptide/nickel transport system permease subunit